MSEETKIEWAGRFGGIAAEHKGLLAYVRNDKWMWHWSVTDAKYGYRIDSGVEGDEEAAKQAAENAIARHFDKTVSPLLYRKRRGIR